MASLAAHAAFVCAVLAVLVASFWGTEQTYTSDLNTAWTSLLSEGTRVIRSQFVPTPSASPNPFLELVGSLEPAWMMLTEHELASWLPAVATDLRDHSILFEGKGRLFMRTQQTPLFQLLQKHRKLSELRLHVSDTFQQMDGEGASEPASQYNIRVSVARSVSPPGDQQAADRSTPAGLLTQARHLARRLQATSPVRTRYLNASEGVVHNFHVDGLYQFHTVLEGTATYILLPPATLQAMFLFPNIHPHRQYSQLDCAALLYGGVTTSMSTRFREFFSHENTHSLTASAQIVSLQRGMTLYIPPFWAHCVVYEQTANTVAEVWLEAETAPVVTRLRSQPMPFPEEWAHDQMYSGIASLVSTLLTKLAVVSTAQQYSQPLTDDTPSMDVEAETSSKSKALWKELVSGRYRQLASLKKLETVFVDSCGVDHPSQAEHLLETASALVSVVSRLPHEVAETIMLDYIEDMLVAAVGAERVLPFLQAAYVTCQISV